jgi:hypothetical protein
VFGHGLINNLHTLVDLLGDTHAALRELLPGQRRHRPRQPYVKLAGEPGGLVAGLEILAALVCRWGPQEVAR